MEEINRVITALHCNKAIIIKLITKITLQLKQNKRPVGLYSPLTAGIMTDFVIMIL